MSKRTEFGHEATVQARHPLCRSRSMPKGRHGWRWGRPRVPFRLGSCPDRLRRPIVHTVFLAVGAVAFSAGSASAAGPVVVANSNDAGTGSRREAILDVEAFNCAGASALTVLPERRSIRPLDGHSGKPSLRRRGIRREHPADRTCHCLRQSVRPTYHALNATCGP